MNPHETEPDVVLDLVWNVDDEPAVPTRSADDDYSWNFDGDVLRDLLTRAS